MKMSARTFALGAQKNFFFAALHAFRANGGAQHKFLLRHAVRHPNQKQHRDHRRHGQRDHQRDVFEIDLLVSVAVREGDKAGKKPDRANDAQRTSQQIQITFFVALLALFVLALLLLVFAHRG